MRVAHNFRDLSGYKYSRLTVVKRDQDRSGRTCWLCLCDCGKTKSVTAQNLLSGRSKSCGCLQKEKSAEAQFKHGGKGTPEYKIWKGIRARCNNINYKDFHDYGGRGIAVTERWDNFSNFIADMGKRPSSNHSIDRKDVNGNYEPSNCRWATPEEQANNKRTQLKPMVGIYWKELNKKWEVHFRSKYIGLFNTIDEAKQARKDEEQKYRGTAL